MRHNKKYNHLSRTASHRHALLANMAIALIREKRIVTTLAKAKALRVYVEPIITRAKKDNLNNRRTIFRDLQNKEAVTELFSVIAPKVADRPGGYTRILKLGRRRGDDTMTCFIELVDFDEVYAPVTKSAKSGEGKKAEGGRKRRTRRSSGKKAADRQQETAEEQPGAEEHKPAEAPSTGEEEPKAAE